MDGLPNLRSEVASSIAKWANAPAQAGLFKSAPVKGDIGIIVSPETQIFNYLLEQAGTERFYTRCMWGAYQGFFDNHIQADWVHIDHIEEYDTLYFPYPIQLSEEKAKRLAQWVHHGGTLISEGLPGYFGDLGHVGVVQPNYGLDELFGAREAEVEFMPDISTGLGLTLHHLNIRGGLFLQSYKTAGGNQAGQFSDGRIAAVEHKYGKGKTLLVGTFPSESYGRTKDSETLDYFRYILEWAGKHPSVTVTKSSIRIRLQNGEGGKYLWALNPTDNEDQTTAEIAEDLGPIHVEAALWGSFIGQAAGNKINLRVPGKDAVILKLQ